MKKQEQQNGRLATIADFPGESNFSKLYKKSIFLILLLFSSMVFAQTPEEQISIASDGVLLNSKGAPVLLLGAQLQPTGCVVRFVKNKHPEVPAKFDYIYNQLPEYSSMKKSGFNTMCYSPSVFWYRVFSPKYKNYDKALTYTEYKEQMLATPGMLYWLRPIWLEKSQEMFSNIKMPIIVETHVLNHLFRRKKWFLKHVGGEKLLCKWNHGSSYSIRIAIGDPEGKEIIYKMWRHAARWMKHCGTKVLAYELFNEPKYNDESIYNIERFHTWLKTEYKTVAQLNKTWNSSFKDFKNVNKTISGYKVDWNKFCSEQITEVCKGGAAEIRKIDPDASVTVQSMGNSLYRQSWPNFNWFELSKFSGMINTGTANHRFFSNIGLEDTNIPFVQTPDVTASARENIMRMKVMRALADGKPMVNGECYTGNRYDYLYSIIWNETMRGENIIYLFAWYGLGGSKDRALFAPWDMLNIHYFPLSGFKAITDARDQIAQLSDIILPRKNRTKAECAILFSQATIRWDGANGTQNNAAMTTAGMALNFSHYAFDAVWEEQLPENRLDRYKVLFAYGVNNTYPETLPKIESFVKNGGILIVGMNSMALDEYGKPRSNPLFDFTLTPGDNKTGTLSKWGASAKNINVVSNAKKWKVLAELNGNPAVLKRTLGKGSIYFIAPELSDYGTANLINDILPSHNINSMVKLYKSGSSELAANVEIHKATAKGVTIYTLMNLDEIPKLVDLSSAELKDAKVISPFDKKSYLVSNDSVKLLLQFRKPLILAAGAKDVLDKRFGTFPVLDTKELNIQYQGILKAQKARLKTFKPGRCINIEQVANKGFDNQQHWPAKSAWFDAENKDLVGVPFHVNIIGDVKFDIIRMDFNDNRTCIALKSKNLPDGLPGLKNITIDEKVKSISFAYAVTNAENGEKAMTIRVIYADGSSLDIPVTVGENIGDWNIDKNQKKVKKLPYWSNPDGRGFFVWEWKNPSPSKKVKSLDLISGKGQSTPIIVGITTHPAAKEVNTMTFKNWNIELGKSKKNGNIFTLYKKYPLGFVCQDKNGFTLPKDKMSSAMICYSVNNSTNKRGNRVPLIGQVFRVFGKIGKKRVRSGASALTNVLQYTTSYTVLDNNPDTWQEIKVPFSLMLKDTHGKTIENIEKLQVQAHQKDCSILIKDLRLEWDK